MSSRKTLEPTPEGRLSAVARDLVVSMYRQERARNPNVIYPNVPDNMDFKDAMAPYVQLELLRARLDEAHRPEGETKRLASLQRALELVNQMSELSDLIKAQEKARDGL